MIFKSSLDLHKETDGKQLPSFRWQGCCGAESPGYGSLRIQPGSTALSPREPCGLIGGVI